MNYVIAIVGPSGSGKDTICHCLEENYPSQYKQSISYTDRIMRDYEKNGKQYWFVSPAVFRLLQRSNSLIQETVYNGNHYGTSKEDLESLMTSYQFILMVVDYNGEKSLRQAFDDDKVISVFVSPHENDEKVIEILHKRMTHRGDSFINIKRRLGLVEDELKRKESFDGLFYNTDELSRFEIAKQFDTLLSSIIETRNDHQLN